MKILISNMVCAVADEVDFSLDRKIVVVEIKPQIIHPFFFSKDYLREEILVP